MMGFWDAVASAGPYANSLHLTPDRITTPAPHHSIFTGRMLFLAPSNSVEALKAKKKVKADSKHKENVH